MIPEDVVLGPCRAGASGRAVLRPELTIRGGPMIETDELAELAQAFKKLGGGWLRYGGVETDEEAAERVYNEAVKEYERTL